MPNGRKNIAPAASGRTSRQVHLRTAEVTIGAVTELSVTSIRGTAVSGPSTALITGIKIIAAPKPEKPRTSPANTAAAKIGKRSAGTTSIDCSEEVRRSKSLP